MALAFNSSFRNVDPHSVKAAREATSTFAGNVSDATQQAIRDVITQSVSKGIPPRDAAKLIRNVIGLDPRRAQAVVNLHARLTAQGVSQDVLAKKTSAYANTLLKQRAETIARTEIMRAQNLGQRAAWEEAKSQGLISPRSGKRWLVAADDRLCPYCEPLDGVTVPLDGAFRSGLGTVSEPPLHPNCRCTVGLVPVAIKGRAGLDAPISGPVAEPGARKVKETGEAAERALKAEVETAHAEAVAMVKAEQAAAIAQAEADKIAHMKAAQEKYEADVARLKAQEKAKNLKLMEAVRSSGTTKWMDDLLSRKVAAASGSNPGGLYEDAIGRKFYVKQYANEQQALTEHVTARIYKDLGVGAPTRTFVQRASDGKLYYASEIVENQGTVGKLGLTKSVADKILKGFSADVLTVNWDAVGTGLDNVVLTKSGKVVRIDMGGSLKFRAQGGLKPSTIHQNIDEWKTFITNNAYYKQVFQKAGVAPDTLGKLAIDQIDAIEKLRTESGGWKKFVTKALGKSARGNAAFIQETANLLEARTELLLQKRAQLQSIASAPVPTVRSMSGWPIGDDVVRTRGTAYGPKIARDTKVWMDENLALLDQRAHSGLRAKELISRYTGSSYDSINTRLWHDPTIQPGSDIAVIQDVLLKANKVVPELVWRGVRTLPMELRTQLERVGSVVQLNGFQSSALGPARAWSGEIQFEIKPKSGLYVDHISRNQGEDEFLLPHGRRYRVVGVKQIKVKGDYGDIMVRKVYQLEMLD